MKKGIIHFTFGDEEYKEVALIGNNPEVILLYEVRLKDASGNFIIRYSVPKTQAIIRWLENGGAQ